MMENKIKVLVVDDEKLERILIQRGFAWEENGFQIIGEADSGKAGLEFIKYKHPDVVLTDISMPNMDGLAFAEAIKKEYPDCYIVIITGYREFEYARSAVKIGVEDFLLKPVNIDEIGKVMDCIKQKISENKVKREEVQKLKESLSVEQDILRESFFQRLVEKRISEEEAMEKLNIYGHEKLLLHCCCMNISIKEDSRGTELSDNHKKILEYVRNNMPKECVVFVHFMHNIIFLFMDGQKDNMCNYAQQLFTEVIHNKIEATIGLSGVHSGFEGISQAFWESEKSLSASVLLGQNRIIEYCEYQSIMEKSQPMPVLQWEEFSFALTNGVSDRVEQMLNEYFEIMRKSTSADVEQLHLVTMHTLSKVGTTLNKYGTSLFQLMGEEQLFQNIRMLRTMEESQELIRKCIENVFEYHKKKKEKPGKRVVEQALAYVDENYCDPDITLKIVAEKVFSNESYLSRVFKQEVGQSLTEYITKKRIDESIRLFNTTDLKVYEVAEKVGFRDPHYFSICFKKWMGITVKEFRKGE